MYLQNSYLHVLKRLDASWGQDSTYSGSNSTISLASSIKSSGRRRRTSRSSSRSRSSRSGSFAEGHCYCSSVESGHFSEDTVNSGYYGDDEVERCRCAKCARAAAEWARNKPVIAEYDVISVDFAVESDTPLTNTAVKHSRDISHPPAKLDFDDYIIIPSSREDFCAGKFIIGPPLKEVRNLNCHVANVFSRPPPYHAVIAEGRATQPEIPCKLLEEERCSVRTRMPNMYRSANGESNGCWWRENIAWQLRQRNKTQAQNFVQLQTESRSRTRSKLRINIELADYLNRNVEFRPHTDTAQFAIETDPLDRAEIVRAIQTHSGVGERARRHSVAHLATTFLRRREEQNKENRNAEDSDCSACGLKPRETCPGMKNAKDRERGAYVPRWRESIANQLEMRNFLECKYFTDAIVRRTMSQLIVSTSQTDSVQTAKDFNEYDVISDNEVLSQNSASTLVNSGESKSQRSSSSSFMRLFKRRQAKNPR